MAKDIVTNNNKSEVFIVTGMGRSGTSLVANFLQSAGIFIGDRVPEADSHNRYGYFEDLDFIHFHEKILARHGLNYFASPKKPVILSDEEINTAKELIRTRTNKPFWGWKDPRTCFFLDFWQNEIPNVNFIFLFRHPVEVFLSQLKSHTWTVPSEIFSSWVAYNERILQFYDQHPQKSILCNIHGLLQNIDQFENRLHKKFGLTPGIFRELYHQDSIHCLFFPKSFEVFFSEKFSPVMQLYNRLQKKADVPFNRPTSISESNVVLLGKYLWDVFDTVVNTQVEQHQQLQRAQQQLLLEYRVLSSKQYVKFGITLENIIRKMFRKITKGKIKV
ncbi:MAG TPA: sulfotransferase [Thermodesulfovibrionia bacterium]|nr:sulfotransferase [Thermodesulfovibrionia bacterium]